MSDRTLATLLAALLQRDMVKALTMTDPWCSLVKLGVKTMETRSWRTDYRGPLALHVARTLPRDLDVLCRQEHFRQVLEANYYVDGQWLFPTGRVIAVAMLEDVRPTVQVQPREQERAFGNYAPGRYAWIFSAVYGLSVPIPARGSLGLWEWRPQASFWKDVQAQYDQVTDLKGSKSKEVTS